MIDRTALRFGLKPRHLAADSAYASAANLAWLVKERQIEPHIPVSDRSNRTYGTFSRSNFIFDTERNHYTCPQGKLLVQFRRNYTTPRSGITKEGTRRYRSRKSDCHNGTTLQVRVGGHGPAVVMLHGFGDTGDMWAPLAAAMAKDHTVIVPDLRGMGLSAHPKAGYDKKTEGQDIAGVMDALKIDKADLVTHDIGNMVGYALAAQHQDRITKWVAMDAPLPGLAHWDETLKSPALWRFNFRGPDVERLVAGRERIYLDRFYNELSANPKAINKATRRHYASLYARPNAMHDAFEQFAAFTQDGMDNQSFLAKGGKLTMPVLAIGADHSFGDKMAVEIGFAASNVTGKVIVNSGHWLMEEQPAATVATIQEFLK